MRGAFALIALLSVFWPGLVFSALKVEQLKSPIDPEKADNFAIPLIVGTPANVALRINHWLQHSQLGLIDGKYTRSPFEKQGSETGTVGLSYSVLDQTPGYLSLELRGDHMGAYSSSSSRPVVFDLQSGERIELVDLLTPAAMGRLDKRMLRARLAAIDELLGRPDMGGSSPGSDDGHEDSQTQRQAYRECRVGMIRGELTRNDFYLAGGKLTLLQGCEFPHVIQALDDLMDLPYSETYAELAPDLTPYGRCLLLSHTPGCDLRATTGLHEGLYVGELGDKLPISLMIFGDGQPFYFYNRYKLHIPLTLTRMGAGHILLRLDPDDGESEVFDLRVAAHGSLSGSWTQGGREKLPVTLH